jgi:hypothetical protein
VGAAAGGHQGTACLDLDGNKLWENRSIKYNPQHGNGATPIIAANNLIFSCDGRENPFVIGLDIAARPQGPNGIRPRSDDPTRPGSELRVTSVASNNAT